MPTKKVEAFQIAARIEVDNRRAQASLRETESQAKKTAGFLGKLKGALGGVNKVAGGVSGGGLLGGAGEFLQMLPGLGTLASGLQNVGGLMKGAVGFGFDFNRVMEEGLLSFEVMLKDAGAAKQLLSDIDKMSVDSPLDLPNLVEAAQTIKTFKFETSEVTRILTLAGDAAGTNKEKFDSFILAVGQMKARGKVSAEEMNQLLAAQIDGWGYVADDIAKVDKAFAKLSRNEQAAKVRWMGERDMLDAERVVESIFRGIENELGGRGKKVANETASGLESALSDASQRAAGAATKGAFDEYKKGLRLGIATVGSETVQGLAQGISAGTTKVSQAGEQLGAAVISGAKNILGIQSPSKVFHGIGVNVAEGFENGLVDRTSLGFRRWSKEIERAGGDAFVEGVEGIARRLGIDPNHLLNVIAFESGFNPRARNPKSSARGLIQFMDSTARGMGLGDSDVFLRMSAMEQLKYVERYFSPYAGRMRDQGDVYAAVAGPAALRRSDRVLYRRGSEAYGANRIWDADRDGIITAGEIGRLAAQKGGFGGRGGGPVPVEVVAYRHPKGDLQSSLGVWVDRPEAKSVDGGTMEAEVSESVDALKVEIGELGKTIREISFIPVPVEPGGVTVGGKGKGKVLPFDPRRRRRQQISGHDVAYPRDKDGKEIENPTKAQQAVAGMKAAWQGVKDIGKEAMSDFAGGMGSMVESWVLLGDESDASMKKMTASVLAGVASQCATLAIMHTAMGIAALTPWGAVQYGPASAQFAAAALFASVAGATALTGRAIAGDSFKSKDEQQTQEQQNQLYADASNPANNFTRRATGGPAYRGRAYIVGDGGRPEVFEPSEDGYVHRSVGAYEEKLEGIRRRKAALARGGLHGFERPLYRMLTKLEAHLERLGSVSPDDLFTRHPKAVAAATLRGLDGDHGMLNRMQRRVAA